MLSLLATTTRRSFSRLKSASLSAVCAALLAALLSLQPFSALLASANDFVQLELRVDLPQVYGSWNFMSEVAAKSLSSGASNGNATNGWLAVNLAQLQYDAIGASLTLAMR